MGRRSSRGACNAIFTAGSGRRSTRLAAATGKIFLQFHPQSPIIFIGNCSNWHMMMQTSSARTIPGVWCNLTVRGVPAVLGILLAVQTALLAPGAPARRAHAIDRFEAGKYSEATQELQAIQRQLPKRADYVGLYLASSRVELRDFEQARKDLAVFHNLSAPSPLSARATLVEAKALTATGSASGEA